MSGAIEQMESDAARQEPNTYAFIAARPDLCDCSQEVSGKISLMPELRAVP